VLPNEPSERESASDRRQTLAFPVIRLVSERREIDARCGNPGGHGDPEQAPMSVLLAAEPARSVSSDEI